MTDGEPVPPASLLNSALGGSSLCRCQAGSRALKLRQSSTPPKLSPFVAVASRLQGAAAGQTARSGSWNDLNPVCTHLKEFGDHNSSSGGKDERNKEHLHLKTSSKWFTGHQRFQFTGSILPASTNADETEFVIKNSLWTAKISLLRIKALELCGGAGGVAGPAVLGGSALTHAWIRFTCVTDRCVCSCLFRM